MGQIESMVEEHVRLAAKIELELRKCERDVSYFINEYVHIEDLDSAEIAVPFSLWPKQKEALDAFTNNRLVIVLKARQLGLTWLAMGYSLHTKLFTPGRTVVGMSRREDDAKELVRRLEFILRYLPKWMIRHVKDKVDGYAGPTWDSSVLSITINHPGKEPSVFRSMSSAPDSGRSFTANLVVLDEWAFQQWAEEIWSSAYPIVNRPTGGQVIGLSTAKRGTLFEKMWQQAERGENGFKAVFLPWNSDPRRTEEWYEKTKRALPNTCKSEYPATPTEAFSVGQGAFFEEWDEEVHVIGHWEPPKEWAIYGSYDAGYASRACFKWYAVSPDGWAICFKEYYPTRTIDRMQAEEIKRLSVYSDGTPMKFHLIVADTDAWVASRDTGKSTAETFSDMGLVMVQATKDLENGWRRLHEWLQPFEGPDGKMMAMLRFTANCKNTRRTYPACVSSKTNPEDIDSKCEHHPQDVDRYFVMARPAPTVVQQEVRKVKTFEDEIWEHIRQMQNSSRVDDHLGSDW